jgi:hypothetical protein
MSDFFADKTYQNLDWISQAVEPWEWSAIPAYAAIPDQIILTPEILRAAVAKTQDFDLYGTISRVDVIDVISTVAPAEAECLRAAISTDLSYGLDEFFGELIKFSIEDDTNLDLVTFVANKPMVLVKLKPTIGDAECTKVLLNRANSLRYSRHRDASNTTRTSEILDLMGPGKIVRGAGARHEQLVTTLMQILREDKWRIRSVDLGLKLVSWIEDYIQNGSLSAMANFAKLKVMTHAGAAIYSIQEVE